MDQLGLIMEINGIPPDDVLEEATRRHLFFDDENNPNLQPNTRGKIRRPNTKTLSGVLRCHDESFLQFIEVT
jgi:dual specificity tyrosine-phosphorylation-regulated kinase 2/3/4